MRQTLLFLLAFLALGYAARSQSYLVAYFPNAGNPGGVNTEGDAPGLSGWTNLVLGPQAANIWSPTVAIPFSFNFFGQPVTHFKASQNGVVTFDTLVTALPGNNEALPSANFPDKSVAGFWDSFTGAPPTASGDDIRYKVFGTAPNRQLWIKWYSFEMSNLSFVYNSIVLEEGTNKIYIVDQYSSTTPTPLMTATVGVQLNSSTGVQFGSNVSLGGNGTATTDNDYYEFFPVSGAALDAAMLSVRTSQAAVQGCASAAAPVTIRVRNVGTSPISGMTASFTVDGGTPSAPEPLPGTLQPGDTLIYTFTATAALVTPGPHTILATADLSGDGDPANNTAGLTVTTIAGQTPPLPAVNFTGFTGSNIPTLFPGWFEAEGFPTPLVSTASSWTSDDFGNVTGGPNGISARFNLFTTGNVDWIISPKFTAAINTILQFDLALTQFTGTAAGTMGSDDRFEVMVSTDCGVTFTPIATFNNTSTISNTGQVQIYALNAYAGQEIIIGFFATDGTVNDPEDVNVYIDNIQIKNVFPQDIAAVSMAEPEAVGCFTAADTVSVLIRNEGLLTHDFSVNPVTVTVNIGGPLAQSFSTTVSSGTLASTATQIVQVTTAANLSAAGTYTFSITATFTGDPNASNDAASATRTAEAALTPSLPAVTFTGFTGSNLSTVFPGWREAEGTSSLTYGTSGWASVNFGNTATPGPNGIAAAFNIWNTGDNDWIVSPKFVASANTEFSFDLALTDFVTSDPGALGSDDRFEVRISTDCGLSFSTLAAYTNTSVISNTGQPVSFSLAPYAGQEVILAFFATEGTVDDPEDVYVFVDNVNIRNLIDNDVRVVAIPTPVDNLCGDSLTYGSVIIRSNGQLPASAVPVTVIVTTAAGVDTFALTAPGPLALDQQDTLSFGPFNTIGGGAAIIEAYSAYPGDTIYENDSLDVVRIFRNSLPPSALPAAPVCPGDTVTLTAVAEPSTTFAWYDAPTGGTLLSDSATLTVNPAATTTYYLERAGASFSAGPATNGFGGGGTYSFFADGLVFDAISPFVLKSVRVYPFSAGQIVVNVFASGASTPLHTKTVAFGNTVSDTVITLDFLIPAGTGYTITAGGSTVSGLFRNNSGAVYPYQVPNQVSITGPINALAGFYYFFYDWKIEATVCPSDRGAVQVTVLPLAEAGFTGSSTELVLSLTDASQEADSVRYTFGDGASSSAANAVHTYAAPGSYEVCQIAYGACANDTICETFVVTCTPPVPVFGFTTGDLTASFSDSTAGADSVRYFFGDGSSSSSPVVTHQYPDTGLYEVCLVAYSICGADTTCQAVQITCAFAVAGFEATATGTSVAFASAAVNADSVKYDFGNGNTSNDPNPTFDFGATGSYEVCQIAYNICGTDTVCQTIRVIATGLEGLLDAASLELFPNPAEEHVVLKLSTLRAADLTVEIVDMKGKVAASQTFERVAGEWQHRFDLGMLAEGIYLVKVSAEGGSVLRKLFVK
ncbi:MAG: PKD domain-containing protein [Bacteroidia bacterium]|nr:PKD domain-containing protein [Bacteroidia bacterium]